MVTTKYHTLTFDEELVSLFTECCTVWLWIVKQEVL